MQATEADLNRWQSGLHRIDTWPEFEAFKDEVLGYELDDPEPGNDLGAERPSIRSRAIGMIGAAASRCAQAKAGISHPAGPDIYRTTRKTPIASGMLLAWGIWQGDQALLIPVSSLASYEFGQFFETNYVSQGHFAQIRAMAQANYDRIKNLSFPPASPEFEQWRKKMDYYENILVHGDLPGTWKVSPTVARFASSRVVIL